LALLCLLPPFEARPQTIAIVAAFGIGDVAYWGAWRDPVGLSIT